MVLALWYAKSNFQVHYLICLSSTKLLGKVLSPTRIVKICIVLKSSPVLDMITKHSSHQKIKKSKQFRKLNYLHLIVFSWWFDETAMNNKITSCPVHWVNFYSHCEPWVRFYSPSKLCGVSSSCPSCFQHRDKRVHPNTPVSEIPEFYKVNYM